MFCRQSRAQVRAPSFFFFNTLLFAFLLREGSGFNSPLSPLKSRIFLLRLPLLVCVNDVEREGQTRVRRVRGARLRGCAHLRVRGAAARAVASVLRGGRGLPTRCGRRRLSDMLQYWQVMETKGSRKCEREDALIFQHIKLARALLGWDIGLFYSCLLLLFYYA